MEAPLEHQTQNLEMVGEGREAEIFAWEAPSPDDRHLVLRCSAESAEAWAVTRDARSMP